MAESDHLTIVARTQLFQPYLRVPFDYDRMRVRLRVGGQEVEAGTIVDRFEVQHDHQMGAPCLDLADELIGVRHEDSLFIANVQILWFWGGFDGFSWKLQIRQPDAVGSDDVLLEWNELNFLDQRLSLPIL